MKCRLRSVVKSRREGGVNFALGEETWSSLVAESAAEQWTVLRGLESGVTYEVKVIAGDDAAHCTENAQSDVKRIQIDVKRGSHSLAYLS